MAVKREKETASKARKIRKIIVAGGDQVAQAIHSIKQINRKASIVQCLTRPVSFHTRCYMNTEYNECIDRNHTSVKLESTKEKFVAIGRLKIEILTVKRMKYF